MKFFVESEFKEVREVSLSEFINESYDDIGRFLAEYEFERWLIYMGGGEKLYGHNNIFWVTEIDNHDENRDFEDCKY